MGNSHSRWTSDNLVYRIRYNDPSLTELGLTTALEDDDNHEELDSVIRYLPQNRTIRSAVLFDAFTSHVMHQNKWKEFLQALVSVQSLQQVELLETCVPFDTLTQLLLRKPTGSVSSTWCSLETLAVTDGIHLGSVTVKAVAELSATIRDSEPRLREFVWECKFSTILLQWTRGGSTTTDDNPLLDPVLSALASVSSLTLLGLVNSNLEEELPPSPLISPHALFRFGSQRRRHLLTLDLSGCGLMDQHFRALQQALSPSTTIFPNNSHGLDNDNNDNNDNHNNNNIASVEEPYCVLERLHLQRNLATSDGLKTLLELVKANSRLQALVSDATGELQEQLEMWLYWNQQVREPLGRNPSCRALGRMVVRRSGNPNILFLLLREYPEIYLKG